LRIHTNPNSRRNKKEGPGIPQVASAIGPSDSETPAQSKSPATKPVPKTPSNKKISKPADGTFTSTKRPARELDRKVFKLDNSSEEDNMKLTPSDEEKQYDDQIKIDPPVDTDNTIKTTNESPQRVASTINFDLLASAASNELKIMENNPANSKSLPSLTDYFANSRGGSANLQYLSSIAALSSDSNGLAESKSYTTLTSNKPLNTLSSLQMMTPLVKNPKSKDYSPTHNHTNMHQHIQQPQPRTGSRPSDPANRSHILVDEDLDYVKQRLKKSRPNSPNPKSFTLPNSPVLGLSTTNTPIISANNSSTNLSTFFMTPAMRSVSNDTKLVKQRPTTPPLMSSSDNQTSPETSLPPLRSLKLDLPTNLSMPTLSREFSRDSSSLFTQSHYFGSPNISSARTFSSSSGKSGQFRKFFEDS
jgi:zinc finger protein CreA/MIG